MPKIFINPGHAPNGDPDPGAVNGTTGLRECDVVLSMGNLVALYLEKVGYQTEVLQDDSLEKIVSAANDGGYDLFVSIHCNSAENSAVKGTETWYCHGSTEGARLAMRHQGQIINSLPVADRGIKESIPGKNGLYVLTNTNMPACLVEVAFISNDDDEKLLADPVKQEKFAKAIARAVSDCFV